VATSETPSGGKEPAFQPYIPDHERPAEFSIKAIILGAIFGVLFGAVTVYVGLGAGLTVSASIPIAVLSISILRAFGRATILENNIVQTTGSAGESVAAGVIFTLPALIFLGFPLEYSRTFILALIGGWLGVFFMIPLRRQLIVKEHKNLVYPEGTACADVLIAGDRGGSFAGRVFWGLGLGGLYTMLRDAPLLGAWPSASIYNPAWLPGGSLRVTTSAAYLGVGYVIGPKVAGTIFAGGILAWMVVMPMIKFFGTFFPEPIYPGTLPIAEMGPSQLWADYIRPIGAGAVAAAGLFTLVRTIPTIISALQAGMGNLRAANAGQAPSERRTEFDIPLKWALAGSAVLLVLMWIYLTIAPVPGAATTLMENFFASVLVVVFGFVFVTVSSRIVGLIGSSANPISGMTIATLMATSAMFLAMGWTAPAYGALALTIGGVVCIAAANAGNTSQDLKTGFLVGATPMKQQVSLLVGVAASVVVIGITLMAMNFALSTYNPTAPVAMDLQALPQGVNVEDETHEYEGHTYVLLNAIGSRVLGDGKYLYNQETGAVEVQWVPGIGSREAPAPQARLMATVISGILTRQLPWGLVLLGVFLVIAVELLGVRSLAFAVGFYIPVGTTAAIFTGGVIRWLAERGRKEGEESEVSPGSLYASGLIAAGGIIGLLGVMVLAVRQLGWDQAYLGFSLTGLNIGRFLGPIATSNLASVLMFFLLAGTLYHFARKPLTPGGRQ
jgi:putative OPT family oligopeptide transporter